MNIGLSVVTRLTDVFHFRAQIQDPVPYGKEKKNECCFLSLRSSQQFLLPGKALRTNKKITIEQQKPTTKASKEKKEWQFISGPFLQIL